MSKNCRNCKIYPCKMNGIVDDNGCIYHIKQTNADKIRSMSDEELAILLAKMDCNINKLNACVIAYKAEKVNDNLEWLQNEVSDGN